MENFLWPLSCKKGETHSSPSQLTLTYNYLLHVINRFGYDYVNTHCLFAHGALVGITGALIVMREWNERRADTQQREIRDFQMRRTTRDVLFS